MSLIMPNKWVPNDFSKGCQGCSSIFSCFKRRHHCRMCGGYNYIIQCNYLGFIAQIVLDIRIMCLRIMSTRKSEFAKNAISIKLSKLRSANSLMISNHSKTLLFIHTQIIVHILKRVLNDKKLSLFEISEYLEIILS